MKPIKRYRPILLGIFTVLGIVVLFLAVFVVGGQHNSFGKKFTVKAVLPDVGGLKMGDNVWLSGVKVGAIKKIEFLDDANVLVTLTVERNVRKLIHTDSKVKIGSDGLMGNRIVIIYGGTHDSALVSNDSYLRPSTSKTAADMLQTLDYSNDNLAKITDNLRSISDKIQSGQGIIAAMLNDPKLTANIKGTAAEMRVVAEILKSTAQKAKATMENFDNFSDNLNRKNSSLYNVLTDTLVFYDLKSGISSLRHTLDTFAVFSDNIKKASDKLDDKDNTIGLLLHDEIVASQLKELIYKLDSASTNLNEDLEAMKHNFLFRGYFRKHNKETDSVK